MAGKDLVEALLAASGAVQQEMADEQKAYLDGRTHQYKEGFHSGKEIGLMIAGAQDFSARLARALSR